MSPNANSSTGGGLSPPNGLDQPASRPFTPLDDGTWLHDRPEIDVYRLLIDAYRMRMEGDYKIEGGVNEDSLYGVLGMVHVVCDASCAFLNPAPDSFPPSGTLRRRRSACASG